MNQKRKIAHYSEGGSSMLTGSSFSHFEDAVAIGFGLYEGVEWFVIKNGEGVAAYSEIGGVRLGEGRDDNELNIYVVKRIQEFGSTWVLAALSRIEHGQAGVRIEPKDLILWNS